MKNNGLYIILVIIGFLQFSCTRVTVKVDSIPGNTPEGSNIYVAGNFNNWNPSDPNYILELKEDSSYYLNLPIGLGNLKYKFTRGDWASEEMNECGHFIDNRIYSYSEVDTIVNTIESWRDKEPLNCPTLTIVLTDIPENTPEDEEICITGNFNNWNPTGDQFKLLKDSFGQYFVTIDKVANLDKLEYKFTRGNLISVESDEFGNELPIRLNEFGKTDTIYTKIDNWEDLADKKDNYITIVIDHVPENTPKMDDLYVVGNFNGWFPGDRNYIMEKIDEGKYVINLPRKRGQLEFKVTRGGWLKQEMDEFGSFIDNREFRYNEINKIHISVKNWADLINSKEIVFLIEELAENTPVNDEIYLASELNGWSPDNNKYKFEKGENGKYFYKLKLNRGRFEYKITRGSWDSEVSDKNGDPLSNQIFNYNGEDTIRINIIEWKDKPIKEKNVTFIITSFPENTPENANIYISGTFNGWILKSKKYKLVKSRNRYSITIAIDQNYIEYKFNRGNWIIVEGDRVGEEIDNRLSRIEYVDTIYIEIESWRDLYGRIKLW